MTREELKAELSHMAPVWQPRGMAVICFASTAMQLWNTAFPITDDLESSRRLVAAAITFSTGVAYWALASFFRVWMVHATVVIGFSWGFLGLVGAGTTLHATLILVTLLWTAVFVGASFRPKITRIYEVLVCLGTLVGLSANGIHGGATTGVVFAGSFVVIMEILSRATSQLRREATTDGLTGLLNRSGLERRVRRVRSFGRDDRIAVLVVDLDDFKAVNDRGGHKAGDALLKQFAKAWREGARSGDLIARVGGDEFVVVFPEVDEDAARETMERLRELSPVPWSGGLVISEPGESLESCMDRADRLLYLEKAVRPGDLSSGSDPVGVSSR